jgi:hypothetical protein
VRVAPSVEDHELTAGADAANDVAANDVAANDVIKVLIEITWPVEDSSIS